MIKKISAAKLVWDTSLYPRHDVSEVHVCQLADALKAGESFPPILIDSKTLRIIDGVHRWKACIKHFGDATSIECETEKFGSEQEMFLRAIEANTAHGLRLTPFEQTRVITLADEKRINREDLARVLRITVDRIERVCSTKMAFTKEGRPIALKGSMQSFAQETLGKKQLAVNEYAGGLKPLYYINHLIGLIEAGIVDRLHPHALLRLARLRDLLNENLAISAGSQVEEKRI